MTSETANAAGREPDRVLSAKTIWWSAAVLLAIGIGVGTWLLISYGSGGESERNQLDAIKTAGTIVIGTGGGAALLLAARRQRTAEQDLVEKRRDLAQREQAQRHAEKVAAENHAHQLQAQRHAEQIAADARLDAEMRRTTELYLRAAEQLGSDKAPVRLAGLYALERLAQDNETQRQTTVNLWCAYLRMPFRPFAKPPADEEDPTYREQVQERQVRRTAQRLLVDHLRAEDTSKFWSIGDLDLTGALLIDFDFIGCFARAIDFRSATFMGEAKFTKVEFHASTRFELATFTDNAFFGEAKFMKSARFGSTVFHGAANFWHVTFADNADFVSAAFEGLSNFERSTFRRKADFKSALCAGPTDFRYAKFNSHADFESATFQDEADFGSAEFNSHADFKSAVFKGAAKFNSATFIGAPYENRGLGFWTDFRNAKFEQWVPAEVAQLMSSSATSKTRTE